MKNMNLTAYRNKEIEQIRTSDLMELIPIDLRGNVLDIGARDGWFSKLLTHQFDNVVALDLEKPKIVHPKISCVKGNATNLNFGNNSFELVFCAEVLEHIPSQYLKSVCLEIERVAKKYILIGVPFKQDIRAGRTICFTCGKINPPWGHVNNFDLTALKKLFKSCTPQKISYVGQNIKYTNMLSTFLMDFAANPYGTYCQEEPCIHCGAKLIKPPERNIIQKIATKVAYCINKTQVLFSKPRPNWIHILFEKVN